MFKFFKGLATMCIITGVLLFVLSFFVNVSFWYGFELVKGGVILFIIGLFMQLVEKDSINKQTERA
nr:hypothetical protein [Lysinibacillus timonensis]